MSRLRVRLSRRAVTAAVVATMLSLALVVPAFAAAASPGVLPPTALYAGKTYGQWSADWWKYVLAIPPERNPLNDETGARCAESQTGQVFFLVGTFTLTPGPGGDVVATASRSQCTVPVGKAMLIPILNGECSTVEGNGTTESELRSCAKRQVDPAMNLAAEVDGVPIHNLQRYRAASPLFTFTLPQDNMLGAPAGSSPSVADGYYLLLSPLAAGTHRIHVHGEAPLSDTAKFVLDVTYDPLTVGAP